MIGILNPIPKIITVLLPFPFAAIAKTLSKLITKSATIIVQIALPSVAASLILECPSSSVSSLMAIHSSRIEPPA
ncbi:hypothetical protein D3C86_2002300 [compost metagenome]